MLQALYHLDTREKQTTMAIESGFDILSRQCRHYVEDESCLGVKAQLSLTT